MHDLCPSRAWKGGQEEISLRLFHGELAGRMDLEQAGRSAEGLYEGLSYDRCRQMFLLRDSQAGFPGVGDSAAGIASLIIVVAAWRRGAALVTQARMITNVVLEAC